jgi:hypothetical protein
MRIWHNRGFSLAPIAAAMMAADPEIESFVSIGQGMPLYEGPAETWIEPNLPAAHYVTWVREQIVTNKIDIFIPTHQRKTLARADLPCRVELPGSLDVIDLLRDKYDFAHAIEHEPFHLNTTPVTSCEELTEAINTFRRINGAEALPCVKPRKGINGLGFWQLTHSNPISHLINPDDRKIRVDLFVDAIRAQEEEGPIDQIVVMEYLPGPEVSLDILAYHGKMLKTIARTKLDNGHQHIQSEHPLKESVARLVSQFNLHGVVNAQFRKNKDGVWKALEINCRPAGGVIHSEKVGGRILADWAGLLTGRLTPETIDRSVIDAEIMIVSTVLEC